MKWLAGLLILLGCGTISVAQEESLSLDQMVEAGQQWVQENVDDDVLNSLPEVDHQKVLEVLNALEDKLRGGQVLDLASLKEPAESILPILDRYEETAPYAAWLRTRLDYLEAASDLKKTAPPVVVEPGKPPKPLPNPTVEAQNKEWSKIVSQRAAPKGAELLAARLKPIFTAQNVPPELVWVAEVESSFNPAARSPSGAVGLYQLMPATARNLGLSLRPRDGRTDPENSARAAAKYFNYLYGKFKDWPLALAAYNVGEGNVQKLLTRNKAKSFQEIATKLPAETQMYIPKINAILQKREGMSLAKLPPSRSLR